MIRQLELNNWVANIDKKPVHSPLGGLVQVEEKG